MKKILKIALFLMGVILNAQTNSDIEAKVNELINKMTLKEKIGQMTQINLTVIANGPNKWTSFEPLLLDTNKARKAILEYKVGSVLNTTNGEARSNKKWNEIIEGIQQIALKESRLGIPVIYGIDGIHGATYTSNSTMFPQQITTAASWNTENAYNMAKVASYEIRSCGIPWNFSPVLDLGQDPRFPRQFETFGEDPYLVTQMGNQMIKGYQGDNNDVSNSNNVAVTLKHFLGYQTTISGKDRTPSFIPEHTLRELHLPAFKSAIDMGAKSIMINSGIINGIPTHADKYILTDILRKELNFKGVVLTDWEDINKLYDRDKIASSKKEAVKIAIDAGIDMSMVPYEYEEFCDNLYELVSEGSVPVSRINESVKRILTLKYELDLFNNPSSDYKTYTNFNSEKSEKLSYDSAAEAITLLKNKNSLLPLKKGIKILVSGPNSNSMRTLNGAWTYSWQGEKADKFAEKYNTIYEAISEDFGKNNVTYIPGVSYLVNEENDNATKYEYYDQHEDNMLEAIEEAKESDVVILCIGENSYTEKPGDLNDLNLNSLQKKLVKELSKTSTPIILVINSGRPRIISDIVNLADGIINIYLPGNHGGDALSDILTGEVNPSGKLPYSYPAFVNSLVPYNFKPSDVQNNNQGAYNYEGKVQNLFEFGFGLSYTSFEYGDIVINKNDFTQNENIEISIKIKNSGTKIGKETVQLYSKDLYASITPDIKRLRRFKKVEILPNESKIIKFKLPISELSFINQFNKRVVEPGKFEIMILNKIKTIEVR